ncbi:MAG TPA: hypothetical protein VFP74_04780 [Pseudolabrys sp.]|nr:hypothetical protein [Pseudolabrys sp.]
MFRVSIAAACAVALAALATAGPALAVTPQTWVSAAGSDSNSCTRDRPCRTFNRAQAETARHGTINVLDSADYGPLSISFSMNIVAVGGRVYVGPNSIGLNTESTHDVVMLDGLMLSRSGPDNGISPPIAAISAATVGKLIVRNCVISGFKDPRGGAIALNPNTSGIHLYVSGCYLYDNNVGIQSDGTNNAIYVSNSTIIDNATGFNVRGHNAPIISLGNNAVGGNRVDGAPSSTIPLR